MLKVSCGRGYFSKHLIAKGVCMFYEQQILYPEGLNSRMPAIKEWSARMGLAISRLAFRFDFFLWGSNVENARVNL